MVYCASGKDCTVQSLRQWVERLIMINDIHVLEQEDRTRAKDHTNILAEVVR